MAKKLILILGGTPESIELAWLLHDRFRVVHGTAGRAAPGRPAPPGARIGGFGGVAGLETYLREEEVALVVDATHPFAETISRHARDACATLRLPLSRLSRPAWEAEPGDHWISVPSVAAAVGRVAALGSRPFLALGRAEAALFADCPGLRPVARLLSPGPPPFPACEVVVGRGPFIEAAETALLARLAVDLVVRKNSGGTSGLALLRAARALGRPVLMIERPPEETPLLFKTPEETRDWAVGLI